MIKLVANGFYLVSFSSNEEKLKALGSGPIFMDGSQMHIFYWKPGFNPWIETVVETSIWFRLYNLSVELWGDEIIKGIGRKLGKFLYLDQPLEDQKMGMYFKFCVSITKEVEILSKIELLFEVGNWTQVIDREDNLSLCPHCKSLVHNPESFHSLVSVNNLHRFDQTIFSFGKIGNRCGVPLSEMENELIEIIWIERPSSKDGQKTMDGIVEVEQVGSSEAVDLQANNDFSCSTEPGVQDARAREEVLDCSSLEKTQAGDEEIHAIEVPPKSVKVEANLNSDLDLDDSFEEFQTGIMEERGLEQTSSILKTPKLRANRQRGR
ncbi:hypothetical protein SUGI_0239210 [Cryptomeria japonica]|nr:hypothetical protein SUGI_0239210 [Cryptomeria japonica]